MNQSAGRPTVYGGVLVEEHLPGQHDQATHGKGGSSDVSGFSDRTKASSRSHGVRSVMSSAPGAEAAQDKIDADIKRSWGDSGSPHVEMAGNALMAAYFDTISPNPSGVELVSIPGSRGRGTQGVMAYRPTDKGPDKLIALATAPGAKAGVGTRLLAEASRRASDRGRGLELTAIEEAREFYEKAGMRLSVVQTDITGLRRTYTFEFGPDAAREFGRDFGG